MNNSIDHFPIDKQQARLSFNRAAVTYDEAAVLQREVGDRLIERLELIKLNPKRVLDIGCGTGEATLKLGRFYKTANIVAMDFAINMLRTAKRKQPLTKRLLGKHHQFVCADAEALPIQDNSIDFIFSNLTLQWCNDLTLAFSEFYRILKPGGLLMFSTFGPDTLRELKHSWQQVDPNQHVHNFIDMHHIGDALLNCGYSDPVMDMENFTLTYDEAIRLMRDIKHLGAHNSSPQRSKGLTGKSKMKNMARHYESYRTQGKLPATYEVVYGHAWIGETKRTASNDGSSVAVPFTP